MPKEIHNEEDLHKLRELEGDFVLKDDIEMRGRWEPIGDRFNPFEGTLDGGGHTISGLNVHADYGAGLFSRIHESEVRNLILNDVDVYTTGESAGGLTGFSGETWYIADDLIENVYVTGNIEIASDDFRESFVGGVAGRIGGHTSRIGYSVIRHSAFSGVVRGGDNAGGITGRTSAESEIHNCYAEGSLIGAGGYFGGGITGSGAPEPYDSEITKVFSAVDVDSDGYSETDMIATPDSSGDIIQGYYNEDIGTSDYGEGLTTEQMQGEENPPEFMETLDFSEDGEWTTREEDYPTFKWLMDAGIPEGVLDILGDTHLSKRLSINRKFHGHGTGTSMRK